VALRAELERSRRRGYATEDGEFRRGVRALALPVRAGDEVVAALAVSSSEEIDSLVARAARVGEAAAELSARLEAA
jgi:DNA-binding IclR family transcriptional regulator